jgi:DNA-binding NarL/FixJ family response regulator
MKVFIADDSRVVVDRLADLLKEVPSVQLVGRAQDAVILDLQMPGGSGLEVLRTIRQSHPSLWVLICTNYPYAQYRDECLAAGANYFLDKSAEFEKIPEILRELTKKANKLTPAAR